jgi:hypothetical protein
MDRVENAVILELKLSFARRSVSRRLLVSSSHQELRARFFPSVWQLWVSWSSAPSLRRGRVCNLLVQFLLGLARAVTLGYKSRRTYDYILLSHLRLPQPGGPGSRIYIPQEEGGPVIAPGTGFPFRRLLRLDGLRRRYTGYYRYSACKGRCPVTADCCDSIIVAFRAKSTVCFCFCQEVNFNEEQTTKNKVCQTIAHSSCSRASEASSNVFCSDSCAGVSRSTAKTAQPRNGRISEVKNRKSLLPSVGTFCKHFLKPEEVQEWGNDEAASGSSHCDLSNHSSPPSALLVTQIHYWRQSACDYLLFTSASSNYNSCNNAFPSWAHYHVTDWVLNLLSYCLKYPYSRFSRPEQLLVLSSSSSIVLTRLTGPRSRPTTSQKIW